jgi:hypothetical protein
MPYILVSWLKKNPNWNLDDIDEEPHQSLYFLDIVSFGKGVAYSGILIWKVVIVRFVVTNIYFF